MSGMVETGSKGMMARPAGKPPQMSILVPVCNEAENVKPMVREVASAFAGRGLEYELVFIDDGSTDNTWNEIIEAVQEHAEVRGWRHRENRGQSAAVWTGLTRTSAPVIATLDGDLQNDPADIPRFLSELEGADFICGVRVNRRDTWLRRFSSGIARWARKVFLGVDFQDTGCALRVFRRDVASHLIPFNGMHRFLPLLAYWGGAVVKELPVNHRHRQFGVSKYGVWNRLGRGLTDLAALRWYRRRCLFRIASRNAQGQWVRLSEAQEEGIVEAGRDGG
jgi:dolichol-phosphate mannosyltransferase